MGMLKNYLLRVQEECSSEQFPQEAIEWACISGWVTLTGDLDTDVHAIMGENGSNYDAIITAYRNYSRNMEAQDAMMQLVTNTILQPIPTTHVNITTDLPSPARERRPAAQVPA